MSQPADKLCAQCEQHKPLSEFYTYKTGRLYLCCSVDHCHDTGAVRGILHRRCNLALEFLLSDAETQRARDYLRRC